MLRFVVSRLLQIPLILGVVFTLTFLLVWVLPGNPLEQNERSLLPEIRSAMMRRYNLTDRRTFISAYLKGIFTEGDFGISLTREIEVNDLLRQKLPISMMLGTAALVAALFMGVTAGVVGALWPRSAFDLSTMMMAVLGVSLPSFVVGSALLVVFAAMLAWAPPGGWGTPAHIVLPAITLGAAPAAYIARLIRLGLADVMSSDFIRTARAKGLSRHRALFKHALKIAFLPVLSFLGPAAAATLTGSFVVEYVFSVPGVGHDFVDAVLAKDQPVILALVLVYAFLLVTFNLVVDLAYAWVDPRIKLA